MISVVVPVYKSEKTLARCVESLRTQTYGDLEILLVDDGSPDECPAICDAFAKKDARIRVIHKENGGVSSARNAGIEAAQGTYVAFVDSDDYVEPSYCEELFHAVEKAPDSLAICGYHHHYVGADVEKKPNTRDDLLELYGTGFLNMPWNKLFFRENLGRFPENLSLGEDLLFNLQYLRSCQKVVAVEASLYHYIQEESGNTLSSQKRENKLELAKMIRRETKAFFGETGMLLKDTDLEGRIRRVVDTRFLCECLDDVERLPFDGDMSGSEKRAVIRSLCEDTQVREACSYAVPGPLDYRVLQWCMKRRLVWSTYLLSVLRSLLVRVKRRLQ